MWLGERVGPHRWAAIVVGFVGVLIVLQPGGQAIPLFGGSIGLASALLVSVVTILIRQIGQTEPSLTTVFWFGVLSSLVLAVPFLLFSAYRLVGTAGAWASPDVRSRVVAVVAS